MSMDLKEEISKAVKNAELGGKKVLAALSGGVDSVVLTRLLALSGEIGLEIAHVDHGLRPCSAEDARFCEKLARELGCPFHLLTLAPPDFPKGVNKQARARELRHGFLKDAAREAGCDAIALAHHASDQAETVIFRLLRGSGPRGVCGMARWEPPYFRPLLGVPRASIEEAARENGWEFREDPTNKTPVYSRNRIRAELLPLAAEICPGADEALVRFSNLARLDEEFLTETALENYGRLAAREPEGVKFLMKELHGLALPIRYRIYLAAFRDMGCDTSLLESRHLEEIDALLHSKKSFALAPVPGSFRFAKSYGWLWVLDARRLEGPWRLPEGGQIAVKSIPSGVAGMVNIPLCGDFSAKDLLFRPWRAGDRLGSKKVKDILMEAGVERWRRKGAFVAEAGGEIILLACPSDPLFFRVLDRDLNRSPSLYVQLRSDWWKS